MQGWFHAEEQTHITHLNRLKKKYHVILSMDAETFDKIQHPFST